MNRETYLVNATNRLQKTLFTPAGLTVPSDVKVSCSLPSKKAFARKRRTIGQCFNRAASDAGINEVFISPTIDDSIEVLGVLIHELIHAIDDCKNGHRKPFVDMMNKLGLGGKPTATEVLENSTLHDHLSRYIKRYGSYPHQRLNMLDGVKKQTTRMHKVECECGFIYRCSQKAMDMIHWAHYSCPSCGGNRDLINI